MAGALRKTMVYLGLAEDDDRYADDDHRDDVTDYDDDRRRGSAERERPAAERPETGAAVTQLPRRPAPVARLSAGSGLSRTACCGPARSP